MPANAIKNPTRACPDAAWWTDMLEGRLSDKEQAGLSIPLENCVECQRTLERLTLRDASWPDGAMLEKPLRPVLRKVIEKLKAEGQQHLDTVALNTTTDSSDLPFLRPSTTPESLGRLGAYEVQSVIGRGGMGVVLKAFDTVLKRTVAIKVLAPQW